MRGPQPPLVTLTAAERHALETLTRRHTTAQQLAIRARVILAAAEGHNNAQIARDGGVDVDTVRLWRQRWLSFQAARLEDVRVAERFMDAPPPWPSSPDQRRSRSARLLRWPAKPPASPDVLSANGRVER